MIKRFILVVLAITLFGSIPPARAASGTWIWPLAGPVTRPFQAPSSPYGKGHRGIDIAAAVGTVVVAPASGKVAFSGSIGTHLFLTLDHGANLFTTYSWISASLVAKGDRVRAGQPVALSGNGHPGDTIPSLHFGVKVDGAYVDPMQFLPPPTVSTYIRLAPLLGAGLPVAAVFSAVDPLAHRMAPLWDPPSIWSLARPCAGSRCARAQRSLWALSWRSPELR
jgi:hypothetical protein